MGKMQYINAAEKAAFIKSMGAQTYAALLETKNSKKEIENALVMASAHIKASNLRDNRQPNTDAASNYVKFLINTYHNLQQNDLLLKTVYLNVIFANEDYFRAMSDLSLEEIATAFNTDTNTVACKLALNHKLDELTQTSKKSYRK